MHSVKRKMILLNFALRSLEMRAFFRGQPVCSCVRSVASIHPRCAIPISIRIWIGCTIVEWITSTFSTNICQHPLWRSMRTAGAHEQQSQYARKLDEKRKNRTIQMIRANATPKRQAGHFVFQSTHSKFDYAHAEIRFSHTSEWNASK